MAVLINAMPVNIATGTQIFGPVLVPDGLTMISLKLARQTTLTPLFWPLEATRITADMEVSLDGGATFRHVCGITAGGGIVIGKQGEAMHNILTCEPLPSGTSRRLRVVSTVTNGPLVSELTVEVN